MYFSYARGQIIASKQLKILITKFQLTGAKLSIVQPKDKESCYDDY